MNELNKTRQIVKDLLRKSRGEDDLEKGTEVGNPGDDASVYKAGSAPAPLAMSDDTEGDDALEKGDVVDARARFGAPDADPIEGAEDASVSSAPKPKGPFEQPLPKGEFKRPNPDTMEDRKARISISLGKLNKLMADLKAQKNPTLKKSEEDPGDNDFEKDPWKAKKGESDSWKVKEVEKPNTDEKLTSEKLIKNIDDLQKTFDDLAKAEDDDDLEKSGKCKKCGSKDCKCAKSDKTAILTD